MQLRLEVLGALVLAAISFALPAHARTNYLIPSGIHNHLKVLRLPDGMAKHPVCERRTLNEVATVTFTVDVSGYPKQIQRIVYWVGKSRGDLFVEHPGYSGCTVWVRKDK